MSDAFAAFYRASVRRTAGTLVLTGSTPADGADVAADAFVRAWERGERVGRMDRPDLWVLAVAMNLRRRRVRRAGREVLRASVGAGDVAPSVDDRDLTLLAAVAGLPPRQRVAVVLRYFADLTEPQCAEVLGVKVGTVAASLTQARRALGRVLEDRPGEAPAGRVGEA
jgi:RNA polymerase sigma-70 factor (ECF subfamily)